MEQTSCHLGLADSTLGYPSPNAMERLALISWSPDMKNLRYEHSADSTRTQTKETPEYDFAKKGKLAAP